MKAIRYNSVDQEIERKNEKRTMVAVPKAKRGIESEKFQGLGTTYLISCQSHGLAVGLDKQHSFVIVTSVKVRTSIDNGYIS